MHLFGIGENSSHLAAQVFQAGLSPTMSGEVLEIDPGRNRKDSFNFNRVAVQVIQKVSLPAPSCADYRHLAGQRFHIRPPVAFPAAWQDKRVGGGVKARHINLWNETVK